MLARGGCFKQESNDETTVELFELLKLPLLIQLYLNVEGPSSYSTSHSLCSHCMLLKVAQLGQHRIFTTCRVYRKLAAKFKVGVLPARAIQRFICCYARIMLDAFALLLFLKIFWHNYLKDYFPPLTLPILQF